MCGKEQLSGERSSDSQAPFFFFPSKLPGSCPIVSLSRSTGPKPPHCKFSC